MPCRAVGVVRDATTPGAWVSMRAISVSRVGEVVPVEVPEHPCRCGGPIDAHHLPDEPPGRNDPGRRLSGCRAKMPA